MEQLDNFHYDMCTAGTSRTEVECSLDRFEVIARVIKSKCQSAIFKPSFELTQMPSPDIGSVEIAFNSIDEICHGLSVPGTADILNISKRERGISKNDFAHDAAVKVAGVYVCDDQNEASPCGIIVCQGIYNRRLSEYVNVLWRQSRQFDMRSMQYMDDLRRATMTVGSLLERV